MPKTRKEKEATVSDLVEKFGRMKVGIFTAFSGLTVSQETELRRKLREAGADYGVVKKTLLNLALKQAKIASVPLDSFRGSIGLAIGYADEMFPAKLIAGFAKGVPAVTFRGALIDGRFLTATEVSALASLPSKPELLARVVGSIASPLRGFVGLLGGNLQGFITVLKRASERPAPAG